MTGLATCELERAAASPRAWEAALVFVVAALALATIVAAGVDMHLSFYGYGAWAMVSGLLVVAWSSSAVYRSVVTSAVALAVSFGGLLYQDVGPLDPPAEVSFALQPMVHSADDYETLVLAGFPVQRIEGHGLGGAPEFLPVHRGLGWLVLNGIAGAALGFGLTRVGARCGLRVRGTTRTQSRWLAAAVLSASIPVTLLGLWELLVLLD